MGQPPKTTMDFGPWASGEVNELSSFDFDLFGAGNGMATGGMVEVTQRANTSFMPFDQNKVGSSLFDVLSSGAQSLATSFGKDLAKVASDSINPNSQASKNFMNSFFQSFSSTKTGQQIQAQAVAGTIASYMSSPITWLVIAVSFVALLVVARK